MRLFISIVVHALIWSGFSLVIHLSKHDRRLFEIVLLFLFAYFTYLLTYFLFKEKKFALQTTIISSLVYYVMSFCLYI